MKLTIFALVGITATLGWKSEGQIYDTNNDVVQVFAGAGQSGYLDAQGILAIFNGPSATDGKGVYALFRNPYPIAVDAAGNVYIWDSANYLIRRIDQNQNVATIAGNGSSTDADGTGFNAHFSWIYSGYADAYGNIIMACGTSIRKMTASTNVVTLAGSFSSAAYANGAGALARFNGASGFWPSQGRIYVADSNNQRIRFISSNPQPELVTPPNLGIGSYAGITINGLVGRTYQIQSSPDLANWTTAATLLLTSSPYLWFDLSSVSGKRYYRAFLMP